MTELTRQIRDINDYDKFKERIEKKYGSKVVGHHQEQGIGVLELANGDEVKYWDDRKLIGNPFGKGGSHFTKTKYSEFGYKAKGEPKFEINWAMKFGAGTIGYAKRIGLTDTQIRQAERAGIGNADDVRRELDKLASPLEPWERDLGRADVRGIDTPHKAKNRKPTRKVKRVSKIPTQVRGLR